MEQSEKAKKRPTEEEDDIHFFMSLQGEDDNVKQLRRLQCRDSGPKVPEITQLNRSSRTPIHAGCSSRSRRGRE